MNDLYEDMGEVMGGLEAYKDELETMILNGKNEKANRYLRGAICGIQRALSEMSDALFEITTETLNLDEFDDDYEEQSTSIQVRVKFIGS